MNQERKPINTSNLHYQLFTASTGDEIEERINEYKAQRENLHLTEVDRFDINIYEGAGVIVFFDTNLGVSVGEEKSQTRFPLLSDIIIAVLFVLALIVVTPLALIATVYDWVHMKVKQGVEAVKSIKVRK